MDSTQCTGSRKQYNEGGSHTTSELRDYLRLPLSCAPIKSSMSRPLPLAASPPLVQHPMQLSAPGYRHSRESSMQDRQNASKHFSVKPILLPTSAPPWRACSNEENPFPDLEKWFPDLVLFSTRWAIHGENSCSN